MRAILCAAAILAACGSASQRGEGANCVSSQECAAGLLCDYGKTPHVCAKTDSISRDDLSAQAPDDLAMPVDFGGADLRGADLAVVVPPDLKQPPDLLPAPMDLSGPD